MNYALQSHAYRPLNIMNWVDKNKHLLKPPICNKLVFEEKEAFIIVIGGANARKEFHYNEAPEFFFQLKGDMDLKIQQNGVVENIRIKEGEIFLLPPKIVHSPVRHADTIGLVVDMRHPSKKDGLLWFCPQCNTLLYESYIRVNDIENDFFPAYTKFYSDESLRTCRNCKHTMKVD